jgi:uncharacterized lipoprotein YmbA
MINWRKVCLGFLSALMLAACAETKPSSFYLLSSIADPSSDVSGKSSSSDGVGLAVGPVKLPKHIDRSQIVTYAGPNRIQLDEFNRWGEPLDENFLRVLGENLSVLVPTQRIIVYPWRSGTPFDYQITVDVSSFAVRPTGDAVLVARWAVFSKEGKRVVTNWRSHYREKTLGPGFDSKAAVLSKLVAQLSKDIATRIKSLPNQRSLLAQ